jgi:protein JSN1
VPSKFPPMNPLSGMTLPTNVTNKSSRPTPSTSPFRPIQTAQENTDGKSSSVQNTSALLSRLRAGSMPQRANVLGVSSPFGNTMFSSPWGSGRERGNTLSSIRSSDAPDSPAQSSYSRDGLADSDVKTLDYLGLAETPQQSRATLASGVNGIPAMTTAAMMQPFLADLAFNKVNSRYRSYSVNATEKYAEDEDEYGGYSNLPSGTMTPSAATAAAALAATQAQIHQHNLAVQAFASRASASRPRARTAGVLDSPLRNSTRSYLATPSRLDASFTAADLDGSDTLDLDSLPEALRLLRLAQVPQGLVDNGEDHGLEGPTRALWLGSIPTSTTSSSLQAIFGGFGKIESARVLVQKNCGFVNFEDIDSAIRAKALLNGKEIFPGAGPVRIGYAKAPSASASGTPGPYGVFPSPSPDPHAENSETREERSNSVSASANQQGATVGSSASADVPIPRLSELRADILSIVREFGATDSDAPAIEQMLDTAIGFDQFKSEIPPVPEPSHTRVHDAPKLREIRKRIDNNTISTTEIEEIALGMLPEIAELSSDYLGNTVVQKLFEFCSEATKEAMLEQISPHLAEIGVHKNGTWAAQKIIEVTKSPSQMKLITEALRPYTVALFLDQYGNYVLQCCLRFGYPYNGFIFESMLSQLWDVAQGRFGARAMRACLESHHSTKDQQRILAAAIALHSVQLATNANGALLLTWFLDTCTFPHRRSVLAPRLVPHLTHLCTHKVAYLTVLKVINQRNEPEARDTVLQALFFSPNDKVLEEILADQVCGATLIFKVLTTPFFDENMRQDVVQHVRTVLTRLKVGPSQGYKRLMDEVGLSTRGSKSERDSSIGPSGYNDRSRPMSQQSGRPQFLERQNSAQFSPMGGFGANTPIDTNVMYGDQFNASSPVFTPTSINPQQLQYQQAMLAASARNASPTTMYDTFFP